MLHHDDHADAGGLVGIVDVADDTRGTTSSGLEDFGASCAEVEVPGWIDACVGFIAGNCREVRNACEGSPAKRRPTDD